MTAGPLVVTSTDQLRALVGSELGMGGWTTVTQGDVDAFAAVTGDGGWVHVDATRAAASRFRGTIAQGFFTLSLLPRLQAEIVSFERFGEAINFGTNRVRFPAPCPVGASVRLRATLDRVEWAGAAGGLQAQITNVVECDRAARPVCVAETLLRLYQSRPGPVPGSVAG